MTRALLVVAVAIARLERFLEVTDDEPSPVGNDFKVMKEKLEDIQKKLEDNPIIDEEFDKEVIKIAYDIESAIEFQAVREKDEGVFCYSYGGCRSKEDHELRKVSVVRDLTCRVEEFCSRFSHTLPEGHFNSDPSSQICPDETSSPIVDDDLVGMDEHMKQLEEYLSRGDSSRCIFIEGMAGTGKTALARKMFRSSKQAGQFDVYAWASLPRRDFDMRKFLWNLLFDICESWSSKLTDDVMSTVSYDDLKRECYQMINGKRFLLIVDDVRSRKIEDRLLDFLIGVVISSESKVLITTQNERFLWLGGTKTVKLGRLTNEHSRELLSSRLGVLRHQDMDGNELMNNTMDIILTMCQGFPTEIIRVASALKAQKPEEWDEILHKMMLTQGNGIDAMSILSNIALSYDHLESKHKLCFVYMALFPPHKPIMTEKLSLMWAAEGIILFKAIVYYPILLHLMSINLVILEKTVDIEPRYRLPKMCHKLCALKGQEGEFLGIVDSETVSNKSSVIGGRVAVYLHDQLKGNNISSYIAHPERIRSLLFFGDEGSHLPSAWPIQFADFDNFPWTRVLNFDGIYFRDSKLPKSIGKLCYLRYLGFEGCYLEEFTVSCSNFPYLETLDLRVRTKMIIPNVLRKLLNLINLYFPVAYQGKDGETLRLDGLTKLKVLQNFNADVCDVNDLEQLKDLEILTVIAHGEITELEKLTPRRDVIDGYKLSIILKDFDGYSSERQDILKKLLECDAITNLYLEGYIKRMPKDLTFSHSFTEIVFDGAEFEIDPMPILGELPKLHKLVLCNDAITVEEISCKTSSFKRLVIFEITNLVSLRKWVLEEDAMKHLYVLTVRQCDELLTLPERLREGLKNPLFEGLYELRIGSTMPKKFKESLKSFSEVKDEE